MPRSRLVSTIAGVCTVTAIVVAVMALWSGGQAMGQPQPPGERGEQPEGVQPPPRPEFPPGPGRLGGPAFALRAGLRGSGAAALAVSGEHVFVLHGSTLYQFAADDLKLLKKVTLEPQRPFGPPGRWGGGLGPRPERAWEGPPPPPGQHPLRERHDRRRPERPRAKRPRRQPPEKERGEEPDQQPQPRDQRDQ